MGRKVPSWSKYGYGIGNMTDTVVLTAQRVLASVIV